MIFPGNAPCHKPGALQGFLGGMNGEIRIYHFSPHAPEPDPAGAQWGSFRRATGNRPHEGTKEMQEPVNAMLREGEIPVVKTYNCLARWLHTSPSKTAGQVCKRHSGLRCTCLYNAGHKGM